MNSPDPWRSIVGGGGGHHGGGGGGGHHHHHGGGGGRRFFGGGWGYPYPYYYPYYEPLYVVDDDWWYVDRWGRRFDRWGRPVLGAEPPPRDGVLAEVAPVLAPATGGIQAAFDLDRNYRLTANVTVDGTTYRGAVDLGPAIKALLAKLAAYHQSLHAQGTVVGGGCGAKMYYAVTVDRMNKILQQLVDEGATITGNNPWSVDTHNHGVELKGTWYKAAQQLYVEVTDTGTLVPCDLVWTKLDSLLSGLGVSSMPAQSAPQAPAPAPSRSLPSSQDALAAIDRAVAAARAALVDSLVDQHVATVSSGWWSGLKKAVKKTAKGVRKTIHKYKGPIALAAGSAATALSGNPAAGMVAAKMVDAAAGDGDAAKAIAEAKQLASKDPKLAKTFKAAEKAVAQTTAAYHVADTALAATEGDADAAHEMNKIGTAAQKGDKAAQMALDLVQHSDIGAKLWTKATGRGPATVSDPAIAAVSGEGDALEYRFTAIRAILAARAKYQGHPIEAFGYRRLGNRQRVYFFPSVDDARAWFDQNSGAQYIALFRARDFEHDDDVMPIAEAPSPLDNVQVSGRGEYGRHPVVRVPVIDPDGNVTKLAAVWAMTHLPTPDYFYESATDDMWLYADPTGPVEVVGARFRPFYTPMRPVITGDRSTSRKGPSIDGSPEVDVVPPPNAPVIGTGGPRVEIIGAALDTIRQQASDAAATYPGRYVGVVRWTDGNWAFEQLESSDDADDWFGHVTNQPSLFVYAAYYDKHDATFPRPLNERVGHGRKRHRQAPAEPIQRGVAMAP